MLTQNSFIFISLAISGLLLAAGLRGRRSALQPRCAKCGYSLAGQPPGSMRCSECGADLAPHHAVVVSPRARRPRLIALGAAIFSVVAVILGMRTARWLDRVDWQAKKPAAWLAYSAQSSDENASTAALAELIRRAEQGALDDERLRSLAQRGLAMQRDPQATWNPCWGSFVQHAARRDLLTTPERQSYLKQAVELAMCPLPPPGGYVAPGAGFDARTGAEREAEQRRLGQVAEPLRVPRHDRVDVEFIVRSQRPGDEMRLVVEARLLHAAIGSWTSLSLPAERSTTVSYSYRMRYADRPRTRRAISLPVIVEPGEHPLRTKWEIRVRFEDDPPESALSMELDFVEPLIVEEPREGSLPIVTDAESSETLRRAMRIEAIGFRTHVFRRSPDRVTVIYLRTHAGSHQRLKEEEVLAPFNGSLDYTVSTAGRELARTDTHLPGGWSFVLVEDDSIASLDVRVEASETGRSAFVGMGWNIEGTVPPPVWMGPPFTIAGIPVRWYETIDEAPLTEEERESIRFHEPR